MKKEFLFASKYYNVGGQNEESGGTATEETTKEVSENDETSGEPSEEEDENEEESGESEEEQD